MRKGYASKQKVIYDDRSVETTYTIGVEYQQIEDISYRELCSLSKAIEKMIKEERRIR